jgi:hypothetical protein
MVGEMIMVTGPMRFNNHTAQFSPDRYHFDIFEIRGQFYV